MKTRLIFLILLFSVGNLLTAQKTRDALYLKNGSIIYGRLMEISENNYRIETADKSLFIFDSDEVEKFVKEAPHFGGRKTMGPGFALESGLLAGAQNNDIDAPFSFNILFNYTLATKNIISAGTGVEFLKRSFTPLFFEYKRLFDEKRATPFIFLRGGALFHLGKDYEGDNYNPYNYAKDFRGGPSFAAGTGISWAKDESETYLSFAYRYARTTYRQTDYNNVTSKYINNYNRLEIKFGFKF